jgi:hypothetical protein
LITKRPAFSLQAKAKAYPNFVQFAESPAGGKLKPLSQRYGSVNKNGLEL